MFFYVYVLQWSTIKNSYRCGGIIESSNSIYHESLRVRQSLLPNSVYIKTSSMNGMIMRPSVSASTRCWRNTQTGEHWFVVMCFKRLVGCWKDTFRGWTTPHLLTGCTFISVFSLHASVFLFPCLTFSFLFISSHLLVHTRVTYPGFTAILCHCLIITGVGSLPVEKKTTWHHDMLIFSSNRSSSQEQTFSLTLFISKKCFLLL